MTAMSLRKSIRQYASHLNREQRRRWLQFRLDTRHVLHPAHSPERGIYNPLSGQRIA
jgi:hypothetical protein